MKQFAWSPLLLVFAAVGCRRDEAAPPAPPTMAAMAPSLPLGERLQMEAAARPTGTPRSEDVLGELQKRGIELSRSKQVLAGVIGASYCRAAQSPHGVGFAVCEFSSEEAAQTGRDGSRARFDRLIPNRTLVVNRKTLLTVTRPASGGTSVDEEVRTATNTFGSL